MGLPNGLRHKTGSNGLLPTATVPPGSNGAAFGFTVGLASPGRLPAKWRLRAAGLRMRHLAKGCLALLALWLCCTLLLPSRGGDLAHGGGAWQAGDARAHALAARQALLETQLAVRNQLREQREAAAARPYEGYLPQPPPKVALMFLVRGNMPLERVWRSFFEAAGQIEPVALPPPFNSAGTAASSKQQQQQQRIGRRRLASDSDLITGSVAAAAAAGAGAAWDAALTGSDAAAAAMAGAEVAGGVAAGVAAGAAQGAAAAAGAGVQRVEVTLSERAAAHQGLLQDQPLTALQKQQLEATKRLEAALAIGTDTQEAQHQMLRARSMEAPLSLLSPVDPAGVIAQQDLFSVYIHTMPGFYYHNNSIFAGYQIDRRVFVHWGQYTVAEAERRLLTAALQDPRNQRFMLISETCTPLYPPQVIYLQLLSDTRSRLNACPRPEGPDKRWNAALYMPGLLTPQQWRKSAQWKALIRSHAEIVASDRQLAPRFERECYSYCPPVLIRPPYVVSQNRTWVQRECVSDEHYIPTLLAVHGKDNETTCSDALTVADWVPGLWSPKVHHGADVSPELLSRLRKQAGTDLDCDFAGAVGSAATMFRRRGSSETLAGQPLQPAAAAHDSSSSGSSTGSSSSGGAAVSRRRLSGEAPAGHAYQPLGEKCFLLSRKFAPDSVPFLLELAEDCAFGTAISPPCLGFLPPRLAAEQA